MIRKFLFAAVAATMGIFNAGAVDFFSTEKPETLFDLGVRVGINTSNHTLNGSIANIWNRDAWGTGFDAGIVADLNFRDYLSVQPGFFFETRSGSFAYQSTDLLSPNAESINTYLGKGRSYNFTIPVVASVHFNLMDELRWNVDFGPYFQIKLKSTFDNKFEYPVATVNGLDYKNDPRIAKCDFGFKMGTSLTLYKHYYVGVHYLAGMLNAWNPGELGGRNKSWVFSIGYNL